MKHKVLIHVEQRRQWDHRRRAKERLQRAGDKSEQNDVESLMMVGKDVDEDADAEADGSF
jgi:hypothetical protein